VVPEPSVDDGDGQGREVETRVFRLYPLVVPHLDLAEEDLGEEGAGELQGLAHPGQVVDHRHRAEGGGDVDDLGAELLLELGHLLIGKRGVGGAEVNGLGK